MQAFEEAFGAGTGPATHGGTQRVPGLRRWPGVAVALAAATLMGCAASGPPPVGFEAELSRRLASGHRLYHEGEYALAGRRFSEAARYAHAHRRLQAEKRATVAECVAWLRSRAVSELDGCTRRLDVLHQRANRSERGIGTLLALGAIAGDRPPPPFRIPADVEPVLRKAATAGEER